MDLLLWRHAEAEDSWPDHERALTSHGQQQAARMAAWLHAHGPRSMKIISSPALRAQQTAQALRRPFTCAPTLSPGAGPGALIAAAGWPEGETVLLVGHQPVLGATAALLLCGQPLPWSFGKSALWWIRHRCRNGNHDTVLHAALPVSLI